MISSPADVFLNPYAIEVSSRIDFSSVDVALELCLRQPAR
jgi:hypothetical protein